MFPNICNGVWAILLVTLLCAMTPYQKQVPDVTSIPTSNPSKPIRILCLGGGGVRGVITARILQALEEQTEQSIHNLFDIILGTSTGGIIGLGLTMPHPECPSKAMYKAEHFVQFYLKQSRRIFQKSIWRMLISGFGLWGARYDRKYLDEALEEVFQENKLTQALCPVGVLSYSLEKQLPRLWSSYVAQQEARKNQYMRDAAAITSAAPTYFAPKTIFASKGRETLVEIDGGIFANNPAIAALIAVVDLYPNFQRKDLIIVSIGSSKHRSKEQDNFSGITGIGRLINTMIAARGEFVDEALGAISQAITIT